jgi:UPF0755 protein
LAKRAGLPFVLLVLVLIAMVALAGRYYFGPFRGFQGQIFVEIERGVSTRAIASDLAERGVVRAAWVFLVVRALNPGAKLQAGEYRFDSLETPWSVFQIIRRGEIFYEDFTVPEGSNVFDIAGLLGQFDMVSPDDFLQAGQNPSLIRDLDPQAPDLEGYLFPSTYRLNHHTTAQELCRMMTAEFRKQWAALGGPSSGLDVHRTVTLASLVERETAIPAERPLVAAVFSNRLRLDMPLQCDPTTVYAALLENHYRGVIRKLDLASVNPYNTYAHIGLPPGPIANPGSQSLRAALHPANISFVYFVAKGDGSGTHHFSATLEEHQKAVAAFRKTAR